MPTCFFKPLWRISGSKPQYALTSSIRLLNKVWFTENGIDGHSCMRAYLRGLLLEVCCIVFLGFSISSMLLRHMIGYCTIPIVVHSFMRGYPFHINPHFDSIGIVDHLCFLADILIRNTVEPPSVYLEVICTVDSDTFFIFETERFFRKRKKIWLFLQNEFFFTALTMSLPGTIVIQVIQLHQTSIKVIDGCPGFIINTRVVELVHFINQAFCRAFVAWFL